MSEVQATKKRSFIPIIIVSVFTLFIVYIVQFVYRSTQVPVNLMYENYYDKEIAYQGELDAMKRAVSVNKDIAIKVNDQLSITFPKDTRVESGDVRLLRGAINTQDFATTFKHLPTSEVAFPITDFAKGVWMLELAYVVNGEPYLLKRSIQL